MAEKLIALGNTLTAYAASGLVGCLALFLSGAFIWTVGKFMAKGYF